MVEVRNRIKADNGFVSFHDIRISGNYLNLDSTMQTFNLDLILYRKLGFFQSI